MTTDDPSHDLRDAIEEGVIIATNGSTTIYGAGSFGWTVSDVRGNRIGRCSGPASGASVTSYRAEGYGL